MLDTLYIILVSYVLFCLLFYLVQHYIFFRPEILPGNFKYKYVFPFEELEVDMEDGGRINALYFKVPSSLGVVFYLKGNSRSIKGWGKFAKDFLSNGYDVLMIDYRGFGKSKGRRSQSKLFNDAQFMYKWLSKKYRENQIVLYGRSFGSGIAARVASWNNPGALVLDAPYFSLYHVIKRFLFFIPLRLLLRYDIRTDIYLKVTDCPVHIIHGTRDFLFPIKQSRKLLKLFPEKINLYEIEHGGHNDLRSFPSYFDTLYDILREASNPIKLNS